jgi:hypothetical protein
LPGNSPAGLVLWWKLDDGKGALATDSSGNGNNGTLVNTPTWANGTAGGALSFNGGNQHIEIAKVAGLETGNTAHTIAAWVKIDALPKGRTFFVLLGQEGPGAHHWLIDGGGGAQFGPWLGAQVRPRIIIGRWTHFAITFDGTTLIGYVNGSPIGDTKATFNLKNTSLTVAQEHDHGDSLNGMIDEVRVYKRALSAAEVAALAASKR